MKYGKYLACGVISGLLNGFFGSGGGVAAVLLMERWLGIPARKAHATAIAIILPMSIVSIFFYYRGGYADWGLIWKTALGGVVGGIVGAKLLARMPQKYIHRVFGVLLIAASLRMIL